MTVFDAPAGRPPSVSAVFDEGRRSLFSVGKARQPALDALRAIAIVVVMAQHWPSRFKLGGVAAVTAGTYPPFSIGFAGVDMFFVLSGFLIGRPLWKELANEGTVSFCRFFLRRSLRIWPYYYFALLVWAFWHPPESRTTQISELFFYANYAAHSGIPGSWSLSTEEQFYVIAPALLLLFRRKIPLWGYLVVLGAAQAAVIAARYHAVGLLDAAGEKFRYFEPLHLHCDGLLFGMALSLVSVLRPDWLRPAEPGKGGLLRSWGIFVAGCALAFGLYAVNRKVYNLLSLAIIFTALTYALLTDTSALQKVWRWRGFQIISMLSFGMYLNQFLFLTEFGRWWGHATQGLLSPNVAFFLGFALSLVLCGALAALTYIFIEHPFLMLRDRRLQPPRLAGLAWSSEAAAERPISLERRGSAATRHSPPRHATEPNAPRRRVTVAPPAGHALTAGEAPARRAPTSGEASAGGARASSEPSARGAQASSEPSARGAQASSEASAGRAQARGNALVGRALATGGAVVSQRRAGAQPRGGYLSPPLPPWRLSAGSSSAMRFLPSCSAERSFAPSGPSTSRLA
jgi:peptidoglycan/LPS O-acetylase OafA/YrhL